MLAKYQPKIVSVTTLNQMANVGEDGSLGKGITLSDNRHDNLYSGEDPTFGRFSPWSVLISQYFAKFAFSFVFSQI